MQGVDRFTRCNDIIRVHSVGQLELPRPVVLLVQTLASATPIRVMHAVMGRPDGYQCPLSVVFDVRLFIRCHLLLQLFVCGYLCQARIQYPELLGCRLLASDVPRALVKDVSLYFSVRRSNTVGLADARRIFRRS